MGINTMALTVITYAMFISIIYGGVKHNLLIDREQLRQSLQNTEDPLCSCYSISVTNVSVSPTNHDQMCYTYSIQYNDNLNICHNNEAAHIIFGICTDERPKFTSRKLRNSLKSIYPNNYNAKSLKLHRSSMLGIKIQNDINTFNSNEQITLCMKNINSEGITSNNMQYVLHNNDVISCKNHANHDGLPCVTNQQPTSQPTKPPISIALQPTTDDDSNSKTWQPTSYNKPTISPTETPTNIPTNTPTYIATKSPTNIPTSTITHLPTKTVTNAPLNAPVNNQLYDVCVDKFSLIQNIELTIKKHVSLNIMIIEIIGPSDKWFGFGFGETIMDNTYTITIENIEFNVFEYILPSSANSFQVNSNKYDISTWNVNDIQINELNGKRIITIKRPYNVANTYDFTSFFECNINSIPIISAIGNDLNIGYHGNRESAIINTNLCNCPETNPETTTTVSLIPVIETPIISDICIVFDQSCNLNNNECNTYKYWISEFLISLENNNNNNTQNINKRICLLGISEGVQILIELNEINDIISIAQIIEEQSCANSNTNLYDALEIAELEFNTIIPNGNIKSLIIFSNCVSTNIKGNNNENEICNTYDNINIHNNINIYIINVQSIDGSLAGNKSNINDTYLNCLTNNNNDKIISITQNNFNNAQYEISKISDQIILIEEQYNYDDGINDADTAFVNVIHMDENDMNVLSKTKRNFVKWIFIVIMIIICLNALCFTFCALRQSGSLDTCFGKIDINIDFDTDIDCLIIDDSLSDILSDSSIIINQ